ncbi:ATP-binding protein [Chitinophagaceae bacterium LB-8]|uniref:histidine kinase n=1 Tax=Paraflavisolibacter caeni TaxID=2982496 RepID=A0A9X2XWQ3_9BACT|nr:ATP-binding protein [Paraflavisolibacter caeni]MCU7550300.1 ATP-binding protein [Paraflavisolibacter caeni]
MVAALFILTITLPRENLIILIWDIILLAFIVASFRIFNLAHVRQVLYAILPMVMVSFLVSLSQVIWADYYLTIEDYSDYFYTAAFTWMIALLILSNKQKKALLKDRQHQEEEAARIRMDAELKAKLEALVQERTLELTQQKEELQEALSALKQTQSQLIQKEKMASLGELTAGIAHEIQNPLNFVNNFSEVNEELILEMVKELLSGKTKEVMNVIEDIKANNLKIHHHGKRADAIVKNMLQHSRASAGKKELADLNALVDEYLRLSYHGLRAKDKAFNVALITNFDPGVGRINIIQQDIGRVLLNIFNNAFYAVNEKKKRQIIGYEPTVSVCTKRLTDKVEIRVKDNGVGVPENVMGKIFQPFYTTKPTGEGTGLGLSLSYDIVTKKHSGELIVETREGEFAEFIIHLPVGVN